MIDYINTKQIITSFMKKILLLIAMVVGGFTLTSCSNDDDNVTSISKEQIEENKKKGEDFLAENAKKEGVITTESGLQYMVLREGDGESPNSKDVVKCHYEGRLIDNRIFDSSYNRNAPSEFALNQVIKGWTEGLQLMKVGSQYRFFIPYYLAYGDIQVGIIPPYSTLIFDVELLEVVGKEENKKDDKEGTGN